MRKTKLIRERCSKLKDITNATECVWMREEGYFTYRLFFSNEEDLQLGQSIVENFYSDAWVEHIGFITMECEDEFCDSYTVCGHVLEVMFLN